MTEGVGPNGVTLIFGAAIAAQQLFAQPSAIDRVRAATVLIETVGPRGPASGTGFVVLEDGTIATAAHVVSGAWMIRIKLSSGEYLPVEGIRFVDRRIDLALLAAPAVGISPVTLGNPDQLRIGQRVLAIGCPLGMDVSVSDGVLSARPSRDGLRVLQISAPVSPGTSGGPVLNELGEVVGLVVSGVRAPGAENINFALPIDQVSGRLSAAVAARPEPVAILASNQGDALPAEEGPGDDLPAVNRSIEAGYSGLDGAEILTRWKRADGTEFTALTRIGLSYSPSGEPVVERLRETTVMLDGPVGNEVHRTIVQPGLENRFSTTVRFTAVAGRAREYASMLQGRGSRYVVTDGGALFRDGRAPAGVIPPAFRDVVLAAQAGPLPDRFEFMVLDPIENRLQMAQYEFLARGRRTIPLARPGTGCAGKPKTVDTEVEVLEGVATIGFERTPVVVLAASPHLVLSAEVKCVRLPTSSGQAVALGR